jgi:hypothetical protein
MRRAERGAFATQLVLEDTEGDDVRASARRR